MGVGLVAGFGASKWVERRARRRLARYLPARGLPLKFGAQIAGRARDGATAKLAELRRAAEEGREAMASREAELRAQLRLPTPGLPTPGLPTPGLRELEPNRPRHRTP